MSQDSSKRSRRRRPSISQNGPTPIRSDNQRRVTAARLAEFEAALAGLDASPLIANLHPLLKKAHKDAIESTIAELRGLISDYDNATGGAGNATEDPQGN